MIRTFSIACAEVLEILKILPKEEYEKIPISEIELLEQNKDMEFKLEQINSIRLSKKANAILIVLWKRYFANEQQIEKLNNTLKDNYEKKIKQYSIDEIFKRKVDSQNKEIGMIVLKEEKWYIKVFNFLRKIFK